MAVVSLVFFAGNVIITQAAVNAEQQFYKICKGPTVQHGEHIADSSGSHLVDTGFRVGSEPITQVCYWSYTIDRTYYSCVDMDILHFMKMLERIIIPVPTVLKKIEIQ